MDTVIVKLFHVDNNNPLDRYRCIFPGPHAGTHTQKDKVRNLKGNRPLPWDYKFQADME